MKQFLKTGFLFCIFSLSVFAQTKTETGADQWNSLKINATTAQEALAVMGKPAEDSTDKLDYELLPNRAILAFVLGIDLRLPESWLTPKKSDKVFRKLVFTRNGTYKKAELSFLDDKLYLIDLTLSRKKSERLSATDLEELYKTSFVSITGVPKDASISEYEGQKEPTIPKVYPPFYEMLSIAPTSILRAYVDNARSEKEPSSEAGKAKRKLFPGFVVRFQIFSRIPDKDKNSAQK